MYQKELNIDLRKEFKIKWYNIAELLKIRKYKNYIYKALRKQIMKKLVIKKSNIRDSYVRGLQIQKTTWGVKVNYTQKLASMFDFGFTGFDMKPGLIFAKNSKISKKGFRYVRIPINAPAEFRTLSQRKWMGWIHPGFKGYGFTQKAVTELVRELKKGGK
ncbi:MAG: hypothetical protein WC144_05095 [Sulfurimonas sp.]|jgi:hypothetical protein